MLVEVLVPVDGVVSLGVVLLDELQPARNNANNITGITVCDFFIVKTSFV